ncbi:hypothetical protein ACEXQB_014805 [Herbiconiux sp. P18]|uniref:hypothetical protein n=1 Tax=Herbiconiux liangxiaofengii TaxID=3342795 RepID=UPI0035B7441E
MTSQGSTEVSLVLLVDSTKLRLAVLSFLQAYLSHGDDSVEILAFEAVPDDQGRIGDPAVWDDFVEALWTQAGIEVRSGRLSEVTHVTVGMHGRVPVQTGNFRDTSFFSSDPEIRKFLQQGEFTEREAFLEFCSLLRWRLERPDLTITGLILWLQGVPTDGSRMLDAVWDSVVGQAKSKTASEE